MGQRDCFLDDAELNLYLDRELSAQRMAALDSHQLGCPDCALRFDISQQIKLRIKEVCQGIKAPARLRNTVLANITSPNISIKIGFWERMRVIFSGRPLIPVTLAGALLVVFCFMLFFKSPSSRGESLVTAMVHEHNEYMEKIDADIKIISSDGPEIERWVENNTGMNLRIPCGKGFSPCGACAIEEDGRKITCLFFGEGPTRITYFIMPGDDSEIGSAKDHKVKDRFLNCGNCTGANYLAWSQNKLIFILVSKLPEDTLLKLADNLI